MKNVSRIALIVAAFAASSSAFAADTIASDSAIWNVTAEKDTEARLVVQPIGSINFEFDKTLGTAGAFVDQQALFSVGVDGTGLTATSFKLETQGTTQKQVSDGLGNTMEVALTAGDTALDTTAWVTLVDGVNASYAGLEGITGMTAGNENGNAFFTAALTNYMSAGASVASPDLMPDGLYTGVVGANFRATWTE